MSTRRLSTNEKLALMLNSKEDEDDEMEAREEEKRAKNRLRRTSLYGGGARTRVPKVKKAKKPLLESPYVYPGSSYIPPKPETVESSVPPGEHQDIYRLIQYNTTRNKNDPDRVWYTTKSMTEGITFAPHQPPWYLGRQNKVEPPDSNILLSAARYGFRGSKNIKQRLQNPFAPPSLTRTEYTPSFLNEGDNIVNEYVPPIVAATFNTINGLESPKLWPVNAEFVTGYPHKKLSNSAKYIRETTICQSERPSSTDHMDLLFSQTNQLNETINDYAHRESAKEIQALPQKTHDLFYQSWKEKVDKIGTSTLHMTIKRNVPPYDPHTLMDQSDTLRYSGTSAFLVHTQSTEELKFRLRMEKSKSGIPYEQRWRNVIAQFKNIKSRLKRNMTTTTAIKDIASHLKVEATALGTPFTLKRAEFVAALLKLSFFETIPPQQFGMLFTAFDPAKKNNIAFVDILSCLVVIDNPKDTVMEKLAAIFKIRRDFGLNQGPFELALATLICCCSSDKDRKAIDKYFVSEFRPAAYKSSINEVGKAVILYEENGTKNDDEVEGASSIRPPYNICQKYMDNNTFLIIMKQCPTLLKAFEDQLSSRLIYCYGKDPRIETEAQEEEEVVKDFSWILRGGRPAPKES